MILIQNTLNQRIHVNKAVHICSQALMMKKNNNRGRSSLTATEREEERRGREGWRNEAA